MRSVLIAAVALALAWSSGGAQPAPGNLKFEVASVRYDGAVIANRVGNGVKNPFGTISGGPGTSDPGRITYLRVPMKVILLRAFGLDEDQVEGPDWVLDDRFFSAGSYTILANVPLGTTRDQVNIMMRGLLKERFKLAYHIGKKQFDAYQLTVAKGGPKLKDAAAADGPLPPPNAPGVPGITLDKDGFRKLPAGRPDIVGIDNNGVTRMTARMSTMADLITMLRRPAGSRHIVDKTGLTGTYDFKMQYAGATIFRDAGQPVTGPIDNMSDPAPDVFAALEKQLGLNLVKMKALLDLMVIDHIARVPIEN